MRGNLITKSNGNIHLGDVHFVPDENGMYECIDGKIIPYHKSMFDEFLERKNSFERIVEEKLRTYHNPTNIEQGNNFWTDENVLKFGKWISAKASQKFLYEHEFKELMEQFKQSNQLSDLQKESIQKQIADLKEKHDKRVEEANKYCDDALEKIKEAILNPIHQSIQHQEKQDKGYEITSYRWSGDIYGLGKDGLYHGSDNRCVGASIYDGGIYSVRRAVDNEEFFVDEITEQGRIKSFHINTMNNQIGCVCGDTNVWLSELTKKEEKEVLFTIDEIVQVLNDWSKDSGESFRKRFENAKQKLHQ